MTPSWFEGDSEGFYWGIFLKLWIDLGCFFSFGKYSSSIILLIDVIYKIEFIQFSYKFKLLNLTIYS
jgi:hypothetical protein